jgi:hypothetical protein
VTPEAPREIAQSNARSNAKKSIPRVLIVIAVVAGIVTLAIPALVAVSILRRSQRPTARGIPAGRRCRDLGMRPPTGRSGDGPDDGNGCVGVVEGLCATTLYKKVQTVGHCRAGHMVGVWLTNQFDGRPAWSGTYSDDVGVRSGVFRMWVDGCEKPSTISYDAAHGGHAEGLATIMESIDGACVRASGRFVNDKREGVWKITDEKGTPIKSVTYVGGEAVGEGG